jgi:predicted dehydrogenase
MKNTNRRTFLRSVAAAGAGAMIIPNFISCSPSQKLRFAMIGVGGRGHASWSSVPKESLVAMCDVDERMTKQAREAVPDAKWYKDFRKMFDEMGNEIDAVMISTPDHTHFPAAMAAMELGKHVFVEKPLAHNIWQLRTLKKAAKYYGVVSQMGNQGHTTNGIRLVKEWYEAGVLGEVREVIAWQGPLDFENDHYFKKPESFPPPVHEVPNGLDWELWQGPVPEKPFNNLYAPRTWRGFYDYGNGKLGDWCCHTLDAPFWALDLGLPHTVSGEVKDMVPDRSFVATESVVTWEFGARGNKAPVTMKWYEGFEKPAVRPEWGIDELPGGGMIMIGDKKTLITGGRPNNPRLLVSEEEMNEFLKNAPEQTIPRVGEEQPVQEWVDAIKNNTLPGSNFDYSASLMEMAQIGVLAQRFGGTINYDAVNMKAAGRPELDNYIKEPVRKGWEYGENIWK